jgi:hypothetical protein
MTSLRDARRAAGLHIAERSSASCGSRMKATSDASLGVKPRGSLRSLFRNLLQWQEEQDEKQFQKDMEELSKPMDSLSDCPPENLAPEIKDVMEARRKRGDLSTPIQSALPDNEEVL